MKKRLIIILLLPILLTGCWNYSELNEIAIATGISIDWEDDKYKVTALISNAQKTEGNSKEGEAQITVFEGTGKTMTEALKNIELKLPKELYLKHISIIIIGEELAKKGVGNILDYLIRDPNSPNKFNILIAREAKAGDILKIISPLETFPSQNVSLMLVTSAKFIGSAVEVSYNDFIQDYLNQGVNPILPSITIKGNAKKGEDQKNIKQSEPDTYLNLSNLAILKNDKLLGFVSERESIGINIINSKIKQTKIHAKCKGEEEDSYIVANLNSLDASSEITKDLKVKIKIKATGYITEANCKVDLTEEKNIIEIQKSMENELKKTIKEALEVVQGYKSDVFSFGSKYYKKYPKEWKKLKDNWDEETFPNLEYEIKTDINLRTKGTSNKTIEEVYKKNES